MPIKVIDRKARPIDVFNGLTHLVSRRPKKSESFAAYRDRLIDCDTLLAFLVDGGELLADDDECTQRAYLHWLEGVRTELHRLHTHLHAVWVNQEGS